MKPYSINKACPKCGTKPYQTSICSKCEKAYSKELIKTFFHEKHDKAKRISINGKFYDPPHDFMLRTCQNCNYQWPEKPLSDVRDKEND